MTGDVRRASAFFLVGTLSLLGPVLDGRVGPFLVAAGTVAPFVLVAAIAFFSTDGPVFELFARPADRKASRLYGLTAFALAAAGLAILFVGFSLPTAAFVAAVFVLTAGNLAQTAMASRTVDPILSVAAFVLGGTAVGVVTVFGIGLTGATAPSVPLVAFVVTSGALLGALLRSALFVRDDPLVLLSVALVVWALLALDLDPSAERVAVGLAFTVALGYTAYALGTASVTGMLTGVLLALFAVVLGGYGWFVLLVTFFGLGGLSSKYRYDEKVNRGIAEDNDGARGSGNVLANSAVALVAVVGYAASGHLNLDAVWFQFAFAGAVAAALADTFSSEFGGLFDEPRLITTLERVEPGTDGGVTWQGALAGLAGAAVIGGLATPFFGLDATAAAVVILAGFLGMVVDSLLGATLEDGLLDNQSVNLLATLAAAFIATATAVVLL